MSRQLDASAERVQRERAFHNDVFAAPVRRGAWKFYEVTRPTNARFEAEVRRRCAAGSRALDFACGRGSNTLFLAGLGAKVVTFDLSEVALTQTRQRAEAAQHGQVGFVLSEAERLAFGDAQFEVVCGKAILHHLDIDAAVREISRVLTPGGAAVFVEPLAHNPAIRMYRWLTPRLRSSDEHPLRLRDFGILRRHFADVRVTYFSFLTLVLVPFRRRRWFSRALSVAAKADEMLFQYVAFLRPLAWQALIVLAEPRPNAGARQ